MNPGSRTPQARILNHARRRPHDHAFVLDDDLLTLATELSLFCGLFRFCERQIELPEKPLGHRNLGEDFLADWTGYLDFEFISFYFRLADVEGVLETVA